MVFYIEYSIAEDIAERKESFF